MADSDPDRIARPWFRNRALVLAAIVVIITGAIVRSSITTSLDSFTFDEAYHVGAGASYVQTGDFRLNPEQPPLTKLWTGAYMTLLGYKLTPNRKFSDKSDERDFVEEDAYFHNDPFILQTRARTAMFALNGLLLLFLALAAWRVFGPIVAIGLTAFLAIDPTVAAHMPVVMTDLPVALASGIAVLLAANAFRTWSAVDLVLASAATGIALTTKHSAIITFIAVSVIGMLMAVVFVKDASAAQRLKRAGAVVGVAAGAVVVLWAFYMFRFHEAPGTTEDVFNRTLTEKISDVKSPFYRSALEFSTAAHLFPRSYIWGMADTIRAGVEGRAIPVLAFGQAYYSKAPPYFFPGIVAAKLPIGLLILSLIGAGVLLFGKVPREYVVPAAVFACFSAFYLFFLVRGSSYAGVRHALPLFPLMAVLGAFALYWAIRKRDRFVHLGVALLLLAAVTSAVPQMRPWEYFNELAGGAENGHSYFNDEGVDLSQRIGEVANYYHAELEPNGEIPILYYFSNPADRRVRGMDWVGHDLVRDAHVYEDATFTGTVIMGANELGPKLFWDAGKNFRSIQPVARLGTVFIFRGTFPSPSGAIARALYNRALYTKIYVPEPDVTAGIELLERSIAKDPSGFCAALELGNQYLALGKRDDALRAYRISLENAPRTDSIYDLLAEQVKRIEEGPVEGITPLRNPGIE